MTGSSTMRPARPGLEPAPAATHRGSRSVWLRWAGLVVLVALGLVASVQVPGWSHASLRSSTPADGEAVAEAPDQLSFEFNEPVTVTSGALRVFAGDGSRVDDGVQDQPAPEQVRVGLTDLDDGGYVATFRVTSADGHVIRGATTFQVGSGAALDDDTVATVFGGGGGPVTPVATLVRAVDLAATLVAVGALLAALGATVTTRQRRLALGTTRVLGWVGVGAALVGVPLQAMMTSGLGVGALTSSTILGDAMTSSVGVSAFTRVAGLLLVVATATRLARDDETTGRTLVGGAGGAVLALGSLLLDGHTRTVEPTWVMVLGDTIHVAAAAVWAGGIVVTARVLRHPGADGPTTSPARDVGPEEQPLATGSSARGSVETVPRDPPVTSASVDTAADDARFLATFSSRAGWAVLALAGAGSAMAWALVRQPRALVSTDYGWTLVAKVAVVAIILVVAAYNRWRLLPAIVDGGLDESAARRQVRSTVRVEVVLLAVVLALTALLVNLRPAADEAGISGAFDTVVAMSDTTSVNLVVDPNRAGTNQVHVYVLDETGRPLADASDVALELTQVDEDIGPIERTPRPAGPGHWILTGPELVVPGTWEITTIVGLDQFTEERATVEVVVNPS